jgi:hypothetical protein
MKLATDGHGILFMDECHGVYLNAVINSVFMISSLELRDIADRPVRHFQ